MLTWELQENFSDLKEICKYGIQVQTFKCVCGTTSQESLQATASPRAGATGAEAEYCPGGNAASVLTWLRPQVQAAPAHTPAEGHAGPVGTLPAASTT